MAPKANVLPAGNTFFIPTNDTASNTAAAAMGVVLTPFKIGDVDGILLDEENTKSYLEKMGLRYIEINPTMFDAILSLTLEKDASAKPMDVEPVEVPAAEEKKAKKTKAKIEPHKADAGPITGKVTVDMWVGENEAAFVKATEEVLLPFIRKNIRIVVAHKAKYRLKTDDDFKVIIWGSPTLSPTDEANMVGSEERPKTLFGHKIELDRSHRSIRYSGTGLAISDGETDYITAEYHPNHLYILHDICHLGVGSELKLYTAILNQFIDELSLTPEERAAKDADKARRYNEAQRSYYVEMCSKRNEVERKNMESNVHNLSKKIADNQTNLINYIRELERTRAFLTAFEKGNLIPTKKYEEEFTRLCDNKHIVKVVCGDESIKFFTDMLYCTDPRTKKVHRIGEFQITIPDIKTSHVVFKNLTGTVTAFSGKACHAPHVFEAGNACWGNMAEILADLISKYEFSVLMGMIIDFLQSVNTDDAAGRFIEKWPVDEERTKALAAGAKNGEKKT